MGLSKKEIFNWLRVAIIINNMLKLGKMSQQEQGVGGQGKITKIMTGGRGGGQKKNQNCSNQILEFTYGKGININLDIPN